MQDPKDLEQRLKALEQAVAELQQRLPASSSPSSWLDKVVGSVTDDEAFLEALALGRAYRHADLVDEPAGENE